MKINENFIMKIQSYMFTIVMIFLLIFGIGSLVTTGTLKAGDSGLIDALTKKTTDSQSAVINNNDNKVKNATAVKDKKDTDKDKKTDKKETSPTTTPTSSSSSGSNQSHQTASPANVTNTVTPAASTTSSSFNVQLSQAPDLVWSAIEISAVKPTMPKPTQKPTVSPTQSTKPPATKPTVAPTTEVTEPSTEALTTEPPTEEITTEPFTEEITTEPTEPTTEPIDDSEPTDPEDTTSEGSTSDMTEPGTSEGDTSPKATDPSTEPHTYDPEATGSTGTSAGTEATTVNPSASSIPTAKPDITSITGEPLTTMPEGIDGAGNQDFGANGGSKALNTATLGRDNSNTTMLGTLLIVSIIFSVVAIMLLGVYYHLKGKKN